MKLTCALAIAFFAAAVAGCDVNPAERVHAGNDSYSRGDYVAALAAYQAAQVAAPDMPEAYFNAGSAFARSGQLERAVEAVQKALELGRPLLAAKSYYNLGNIYFEMSRFTEAVQAYQQSLLLDPNDSDARYNLELALRRVVPPTPSAIPPESTPEPTPPGGSEEQATPTPQGETATAPPEPLGTLDAEEARALLDAIQRDQRTLRDMLQRLTPQANPPEKDW